MCGIYGYFGNGNPRKLEKMMDALKQRGPDAQGEVISEDPGYALGHTRLSIIDLSDLANQPMSSSGGKVKIVFNGEIYNYRNLRKKLIQQGYNFYTESDTEVILNAYIEYGESCFSLFEGMFAIGIVDKRGVSGEGEPKFLLARDAFGTKPIHYTIIDETLYFASETRALRTIFSSSLDLDERSLQSFLSFGSISQPMTIDRRINSLKQGTFAVWKNKKLDIEEYWNLHSNSQPEADLVFHRSIKDNVDELETRLLNAISISTVSDTPLSLMLSGGIDSVSIATILKTHQIADFDAFFLRGFTNGPDDETSVVNDVASRLDLKVNMISPSENIIDSFYGWISAMDQPSVDGFNVWLLSKEIAKTHKVAFTGAGGDEVFAGYPHHRIAKFLQYNRSQFHFDSILGALNNMRPNRYSLSLIDRFGSPKLIWRTARNLKKKSAHRDSYEAFSNFDQFGSEDEVQCLQRLDLEQYLVNTLLADQDIVSMAHGLELRPSYLNKKLVEYAYRLPVSQKINLDINKPMLVKAVGHPIVESIAHIKKRGFELPYIAWMKKELKQEFINLLNALDKKVIDSQVIDYELMKLHENKPDAFTWALGIFSAWSIETQQ
ncbi:asparagine synthase (glutamine-hydrolyzing) [Gammaproteobacteria bacterium]|nr:asparagine synthase (glutamine-hydrolyzing) [Gammaproteobacteria bacterium]|tara:strand:+ start:2230 stop:4047 length:1818 start_codon:yes stop_codon:yes gene_type:complete